MRMCVGDPTMQYFSRLARKDIEIWSIRDKNGKRRFTIEVHTPEFYQHENPRHRGIDVVQIKGKANRLPGFPAKDSKEIKFKDELIFISNLFADMNVDISFSNDMLILKKITL